MRRRATNALPCFSDQYPAGTPGQCVKQRSPYDLAYRYNYLTE